MYLSGEGRTRRWVIYNFKIFSNFTPLNNKNLDLGMGEMGLEPPKDCGVVLSYFNLLQTTISETGSVLTLWLNN